MLKLKKVTVSINDLLLDPNNPRFVTDLDVKDPHPDHTFESSQDGILGRFVSKDLNLNLADEEDDDFFSIDDLVSSMKEIGYVGIDRIVVRRLATGKFVVLEGNRRTATMKSLLLKHQNAKPIDKEGPLPNHVIETFDPIEVMELITDDLTQEQINHSINVILGLRHYGSLLEWEPLPKAYNMYHNYMSIHPALTEFKEVKSRIKEVATRLSIKESTVKQSLKTYITFLQLTEKFRGVEEKYFSLIQSAITNKNLISHEYFRIDKETYLLDEDSLEKLNEICQFNDRASLQPKQIIINEPKKFKLLGDLVKKCHAGATESIHNYAKSLLREVELAEIDPEKEELVLSIDSAVDLLKSFEANTQWVETMKGLLKKREKELDYGDFTGSGNELLFMDNVESKLKIFRKIFGI